MSQQALLTRLESSDQGTFGTLEATNFKCFTGELPWRDNARGVSCIPVGIYQVDWIWAPLWRGGRWVYLVQGTAPRVGILMHSANYMGDVTKGYRTQLQGCIALGEKLGTMDGQKALLISVPAVGAFQTAVHRQSFTLEIRNVGSFR